jgi:iron-sulfur cluster assembly protein
MALLKIKRKGEKDVGHQANGLDAAILVPKDKLGISDAAAVRIEELLTEKEGADLYFRVAIRGGGCSGLSIHYEFCESLRPKDVVFTKNRAQVVIDEKSLSILGGATVHCEDYLGSKEFKLLNNPAEKQCSCGQSFSL